MGFVSHYDTAFSEQIFDVPEAQVKPMIQPHRVGDDIAWEAISSKKRGS
jgi:hypothetical protein